MNYLELSSDGHVNWYQKGSFTVWVRTLQSPVSQCNLGNLLLRIFILKNSAPSFITLCACRLIQHHRDGRNETWNIRQVIAEVVDKKALHSGSAWTERVISYIKASIPQNLWILRQKVEFREIGNTGLPLQTSVWLTNPPETRVFREGSLFVKGDWKKSCDPRRAVVYFDL